MQPKVRTEPLQIFLNPIGPGPKREPPNPKTLKYVAGNAGTKETPRYGARPEESLRREGPSEFVIFL